VPTVVLERARELAGCAFGLLETHRRMSIARMEAQTRKRSSHVSALADFTRSKEKTGDTSQSRHARFSGRVARAEARVRASPRIDALASRVISGNSNLVGSREGDPAREPVADRLNQLVCRLRVRRRRGRSPRHSETLERRNSATSASPLYGMLLASLVHPVIGGQLL
jgi:hypothetical protein